PATARHLWRMTASPFPPYRAQPQGRSAQRHRPQTRHGTAPLADDGFAFSALQGPTVGPKSAASSAEDPALARPAAQGIDAEHQPQHGEDHRRRLGLLEQAQVDIQHLPEAAGADKTENARHADIVFP